MAALKNLLVPLAATAPVSLPAEVYGPVNDLYRALNNLVNQLNSGFPVMMSPNGHYWKATISNTGTVTWTDVGTSPP